MTKNALLIIENLTVAFKSQGGLNEVLHRISLNINTNEIVGVVGESGSGKSITSLAIMGLLPKAISKITSGQISFNNRQILDLSESEKRSIRGKDIAMIFQEPMSSLNPSMTCGKQVEEILIQHTSLSKHAIKSEVLSLFENVKIPDPIRAFNAYPHELSGGQKQRVMIAMAIACKTQLLIADEPTTALDVTVQKEILELLKSLQKETKMSILFISHDLALVSEIADRIVVMYKGDIVESGSTIEVFKNPQNQYTKALLNARPSMRERLKQLPTINDFINDDFIKELETTTERNHRHNNLYSKTPLLEITDVEKTYISNSGWFSKPTTFKAVDKVSFKVYEGETLGLVGESGCGKSTLGNAILQLDKATSGTISYRGKDITTLKGKALRLLRKDIQIIFQDPFASLNPRLTVGQAIMEPMKVHHVGVSEEDRKQKGLELLEQVGLDALFFNRYPHEFSGGQRQRIGIARTIALQPKLIICDESVSALDISVQAQVLNLLNDLKSKYNFTYIFISHDLAVVKYMSDQLLVMNNGKIEELGEADSIYANPQKEYTKRLIHAIPKGL